VVGDELHNADIESSCTIGNCFFWGDNERKII
jgi:hypothetical protein